MCITSCRSRSVTVTTAAVEGRWESGSSSCGYDEFNRRSSANFCPRSRCIHRRNKFSVTESARQKRRNSRGGPIPVEQQLVQMDCGVLPVPSAASSRSSSSAASSSAAANRRCCPLITCPPCWRCCCGWDSCPAGAAYHGPMTTRTTQRPRLRCSHGSSGICHSGIPGSSSHSRAASSLTRRSAPTMRIVASGTSPRPAVANDVTSSCGPAVMMSN